MNLDWYIAKRYLASRKRGRLLSLITWIALGGVVVGVTALIVVIGVMTGMQQDLREKILGSTPHVLVLEQGTALRMNDWQDVLDTVLSVPEVVTASPFVLSQVTIRRQGQDYAQAADLYGVSTEDLPGSVTAMEEQIRSGVHSLQTPPSGLAPVLVGSGLAVPPPSVLGGYPGRGVDGEPASRCLRWTHSDTAHVRGHWHLHDRNV